MPDADEVEGARRLADLAFAELSRRDLSSSAPPPADLPKLLRLCLLSLPVLGSVDSDRVLGCCSSLLASLRAILARDPGPSLLPALEAFLENLVVSDQLMRYFAVADAVTPKRSRVTSVGSPCHGGYRFIMELMVHHFISSAEDVDGFLTALSWSAKARLEITEIGFPGALSILRRSCLFSFPAVVQAHFLLLSCRCVGDGDLDMHLLAFEHAMNVYLRYLPSLGVFNRTSVESPLSCFIKKRHLNFFMHGATQLTCQINRLIFFCQLHSSDDLPINESDIFDASVRFIEENQQIVHEQFRQEIIIVVKSIVSNVLRLAKPKEMDKLEANVSEEIICLAAALRLMGSSLLQILQDIRQMAVADASQNGNKLEPCKVYSFISETVCLLGHYKAYKLQGHDLLGMIGKPEDREQGSVLLLSHIASLSVHCLSMRFGFMWKGCIFMMMMAMNLVVTEERNVGLFHILVDGAKESAICCSSRDDSLKGSVPRKSSTAIALQFKNTRKVHIKDEVGREDYSSDTRQRCASRDGRDDVRAFLKCCVEHGQDTSDYSDILDFIECVPGLDYSSWWKQHRKFKKYKDAKWISSKRVSVYKRKRLITRRQRW
ncbi:hypothetical protein ABZP36_024351 [Zizania latifolia]